MRGVFIHIIMLLCAITCSAQQYVFSPLDTSDGLSDNFVFHVMQLHDGRIVVTTQNSIDLWNGKNFQHIRKDSLSSTPLPGYQGAYHVYADKNNCLWVKDYQRLWCYDAQLKPLQDCLPDSADDVFVDDQGEVYFVQQDSVDMLFDLKRMDGKLYHFYASGTVRCSEKGKELYANTANMLDSVAQTSLVVADTLRGKFYQLVDGRLCLEFDTHTRTWTELFRSEKLHTIALIDPNTAYIVSHEGLWRLDLTSRKAEQLDQVQMKDGSHLSSSRINTVFTDQEGIVWLGTYDHGLLRGTWHTPWYQTGWAYTLYILVGIGILLLVFLIHRFQERRRLYKEQLLLQRIQQLILQASPGALPAPPKEEESPTGHFLPVNEEKKDTEHADLMNRAILLVEQNLSTPGYTVERLAQDLCMDRTGLYKKMTAAIDKTPTAFIRNIRLTHAAQLIREGKLTMSEVAEQTGFSSASYMARCFQEEWGKKPSELRES